MASKFEVDMLKTALPSKDFLAQAMAWGPLSKSPILGYRFASLHYGLFRLFQFTSYKFPEFRKRLEEKDFTFSMKTADGRLWRTFTFSNGRISSTGSNNAKPDFSLVWKTEEDGARVMTDMMLQKRKVLMKAVMAQELMLEGDAAMVGWFLETMNQLNRCYAKKKK